MEFQSGEIFLAPKTVFWVEMPPDLTNQMRLELLKKDIFLIDCSFSEFRNLPKESGLEAIFFFNLDRIVSIEKTRNELDEAQTMKDLVSLITPEIASKSLAHTATLNSPYKALFQAAKVPFLEKSLNNTATSLNLILTMANKMLARSDRGERTFIRVMFPPEAKCKVEVKRKLPSGDFQTVLGVVKDISLAGLGFTIEDPSQIGLLGTKEVISAKIRMPRTIININKALVVRVSADKKEVGLHFNIMDPAMIDKIAADTITSLVLQWLNTVLESRGKFSQLSFTTINLAG